MKNKKLVWAIIIVTTVLSLLSFSFTYFSNQVEDEATAYATTNGKLDIDKKDKYLDSVWNKDVILGFKYKDLKDKELKKGLDLQGGMQVTVEVSPVELVRYLSNNNTSDAFNKALEEAAAISKKESRNFVDLFYERYQAQKDHQPLVSVFFNSNTSKYLEKANNDSDILKFLNNEIDGSIENANNIIRTRIDQFGTIQPNIQRVKGTNRIQIELPGENKAARIRDLIQSSAELNFWEVADDKDLGNGFQQLNDYLFEKEKLTSTAAVKDTTKSGNLDLGTANNDLALGKDDAKKQTNAAAKDTSAAAKADSAAQANKVSTLFRSSLMITPMGIFVNVEDTAKVNAALSEGFGKGFFSNRVKFAYAGKAFESKEKNLSVLVGKLQLHILRQSQNGGPALNGTVVTNANFGYNNEGKASISMVMNDEGAVEWRRITGANVGKSIAIVLDNRVLSAPNVNGEIPNGYSEISGNYTQEEGQDLANKLKAGRMPAPVKIVEEAVVGPSLGDEAINQGLLSSIVGALAVVVFMMLYYNKGGLVANLALLFNIFLVFGIMVQVPGGVVLTLPGIAGVVLTMGMSVDANVLIFERIREEIAAGKSVLEAIELGYQKAFSSIFDSNVTTILTGIILALFGSGAVKGFAVTLIIGIVTSFFTAVYVSRLILEYIARTKSGLTVNSFSTGFSKNLFKNFNFNVIGNRKKAYLASAILILTGFACIFIKGGLALGVDFKGGRSYIVEFSKPVVASDVLVDVKKNFVDAGTEVKTFGASNKLKITTSFLADDDAQSADEKVLASLNKGLEKYKDLNPQILSSAKVGATVANETKNTSFIAIAISLVVIFLYIIIRFKNLNFSIGAIVALTHDVLAVIAIIGIFRMFGLVYEFDQIMVAALLTLVGYSINDTVVIFDRIRETIAASKGERLDSVINRAINETFSRTIITALTVFLVLIVLYVFGGEVLAGFSFALLFGLFFGSYSTVFIASPIVLDFAKKDKELNSVNKEANSAIELSKK